MHVKTLISVLTIPVLIVELALTHLPQIVFMEVVTGIAFLTEALEPVLAHVVVILMVAGEVVV